MFSISLSLSLAILASTVTFSSAGKTADPNGFTYTSCQSAYDFLELSPLFIQVDNSTSMTVELCTSQCSSSYSFAALYGSQCLCGQSFTAFAPSSQDIQCNTPCPGNPAETCGGYQNDVARGSEWWSLYEKTESPVTATSTMTVVLALNPSYTSTLYSTVTDTVVSCGVEVESCPGRTTTSSLPGSTTVVWTTSSIPVSVAVSSSGNSTICASSTIAGASTTMSAVVETTSATTQWNGNATVWATSVVITGTPSLVPFTGAGSTVGVGTFGVVISFVCVSLALVLL
ncbi:uncharacterized protein LY89DRAFT_714768 [Mollisia scopiformis]|uniref:WSC domain-containing protein n=1 Tax=Mollisia scopiformis TaxID=149040 RepID=A0A194XNL8_MOLSC|nr:uncharacterized protein LY89DRAFT_714768 [Mollisia scopiformis]KUJ21704.1 hypothetical protein LY89DRAFT_714768 [Mollisia scopiformis]